ncbi:MAG: DUF4783 domain-containing protein [Saprospiraceae bacterium]|nr:DUF4783 domain-containing protein [Saprospiraceae bacterium]
MKSFTTLLLLTITLSAMAQTKATIMNAIGSGDAEKVGQYMDRNIELCFDDKVDFMTKPQAKRALASFYEKNRPQSFETLHKGESKGEDSRYMIGRYKAHNGNTFRVYVFAKELGSGLIIQEIRFDIQK